MTTQKVAIVTGAGGGIGTAICLRLASEGWAIVLAEQTDRAATSVLARCRGLGASADSLAGDVASASYIRDLVAFAVQRYGQLNGFVSNAGVAGTVAPVTEYPDDEFNLVMNVNVRSTFLSLKHALPALRAQDGGSFVAMASTSSIRGGPICLLT